MPNSGRGSLNTLASRVFLASLVAMPIIGGRVSSKTSDEDVVRELNAGYVRAFMHSDADWYDAHLTPDFACILTSGAVVDRATFLANARKTHTTASYELSEVGIRVYGDAALATAVGTWRRQDGTTGRTRYIDVWIRKDGVWKAASAQLTSVAP